LARKKCGKPAWGAILKKKKEYCRRIADVFITLKELPNENGKKGVDNGIKRSLSCSPSGHISSGDGRREEKTGENKNLAKRKIHIKG